MRIDDILTFFNELGSSKNASETASLSNLNQNPKQIIHISIPTLQGEVKSDQDLAIGMGNERGGNLRVLASDLPHVLEQESGNAEHHDHNLRMGREQ